MGAQDAPDELEVSGSSSSSLDSMDAPPAGAGAGSNSPGAARSGAAAGQQQGAKPHSRHHRVRHRGPRALRVMAAVVQASALVVVRFVLRLAAPLLVLLLRRLVRDVRWARLLHLRGFLLSLGKPCIPVPALLAHAPHCSVLQSWLALEAWHTQRCFSRGLLGWLQVLAARAD